MKYIYHIVPMEIQEFNTIYDTYFMTCRYSTTRSYQLRHFLNKDLKYIKTSELGFYWIHESQYAEIEPLLVHPPFIETMPTIIFIFNSLTDMHPIYLGENKIGDVHINYIPLFIESIIS